MSDRNYASLLFDLKDRRRIFVDDLAADDSPENAAKLAVVQMAITAVEAVMAEPVVRPPPSHIAFGEDGWPIEAA